MTTPDPIRGATAAALEGIQRYSGSLQQSTERIASGNSDLASDAVQVKIDSLGVQYSVAVLKTANEMQDSLLDLFA